MQFHGIDDVVRFSTSSVEPHRRLEYWNHVLSDVLFGFSIDCDDRSNFEGSIVTTKLEELTFSDSGGTSRLASRDEFWLAHSPEHKFHLLVDFDSPWTFFWNGMPIAMGPADMVLTDTRFVQAADNPTGCCVRAISLPPSWLRTWVAAPTALLGSRLPAQHGWSSVLSAFVRQLDPKGLLNLSIPSSTVVDHVGSLLALVESERLGSRRARDEASPCLGDRVVRLLRERLGESSLTCHEVALALSVTDAEVHESFAVKNGSFGAALQHMRAEAAREMLSSTGMKHLSTAEIGRRCGFADVAHFDRVAMKHLGMLPKQFRRLIRG